jgi:hypothetical protein
VPLFKAAAPPKTKAKVQALPAILMFEHSSMMQIAMDKGWFDMASLCSLQQTVESARG